MPILIHAHHSRVLVTNGHTLQQAPCLLPDSSQAAQAESLGVEQTGRFSTLDFPACPRTLWLSNLQERAKDGSLKDLHVLPGKDSHSSADTH